MSDRVWTVRVAQEFEVAAKSADDALAFARKAQTRRIKGATLTDAKAVLGEKPAAAAVGGDRG